MPKGKMNTEMLDKLPPEELGQLNDALHGVLCKTILELLQDSLENPGLIEEEIQSAREFAGMKPDNDAARELLEFLDSKEVREAVKRYYT